MTTPNWIQLVAAAFVQRTAPGSIISPVFYPPASPESLAQAELRLQVQFPSQLKELLLQSNGIRDRWQSEQVDSTVFSLVWPIEQIVARNRHLRANPGPQRSAAAAERLLFFSDDGNGTSYAFALAGGVASPGSIVTYDQETGAVVEAATSLTEFVEKWCSWEL